MAKKQKFLKRNRKTKPRVQRVPAWRQFALPQVPWAHVVTVIVVGVIVTMGHVTMNWAMDRPINSVVINGAFERVTAMEIESALSGFVRTGFLGVDLPAIRSSLTDIPWVANASVRRRWPQSLEVNIVEQSPTACWGERGLLNVRGELFVNEATHIPAELPRLYGPAGTQVRVARMYSRIQERLEQRGMVAVSMRLDNRGAWLFQLNNGIEVRLGAATVERRIEHFFTALDRVVAPQAEHVDYIDMRYTNGFAIGWKDRKPNV